MPDTSAVSTKSKRHSLHCCGTLCYTFPLESEVLRIVPIERIYKAPKCILVLVVTKYKQGCGVYSFEVARTY